MLRLKFIDHWHQQWHLNILNWNLLSSQILPKICPVQWPFITGAPCLLGLQLVLRYTMTNYEEYVSTCPICRVFPSAALSADFLKMCRSSLQRRSWPGYRERWSVTSKLTASSPMHHWKGQCSMHLLKSFKLE